MATLELDRPRRLAAASSRRLSNAPITPASPTIIRTPEYILLPSVPTHEPEDNLPSPRAWQQQFVVAAFNDAQARRSRANSIQRSPSASSRSDFSQHSSSGSNTHTTTVGDQDELEEIVEPEPEHDFDCDPAASYDAIRDFRNQQLDSLQSVVHSIAEAHFDRASSSSAPDSDITQTLDDMYASVRRIGGHNAPLSPTFARPVLGQMSDVDRLILLVERLKSIVGNNIDDAHHADLLVKLNSLTQGLTDSERRLARPALESPPRTPKMMNMSSRRRSYINATLQRSPRSSISRGGSFSSSTHSHATVPTSSDEAGHTSDAERQQKAFTKPRPAPSPATRSRQLDLLSEAGLLRAVPEKLQFDGSVFDMATVRQSPKPGNSAFSIETLYAPLSTALGLMTPQSPRSDEASRAASVAGKSESTALPSRKRASVQTDSADSTCLPGYSYDVPGYEAASGKDVGKQQLHDLPQYDQRFDGAAIGLSSDVKKPIEAPTLLERRRAKMAAQHSAYAARTPEDLAVVESSIDRMSNVMPQLDNQRALSPEQQRDSQLHNIMGRLAESTSKRMNDQRSNPPSLRASRPAPLPRVVAETEQPRELPPLAAVSELPRKSGVSDEELPKTPTTPASMHSASSSRRGSLRASFSRRLSIASIGNALRRASIYDTTKVNPRHIAEQCESEQGARAPVDDATIRRRSQMPRDPRTKYDIADNLASLFNDDKPRKNSSSSNIESTRLRNKRASFRAIDFADDTPHGRDASLIPRASLEEEEDDSMLEDYSFAKVNTTRSNHRLSIMPIGPGSPRSPEGSSASSRRSSQLSPGTPTWPKSPVTPISPVATRRISNLKPTVTFAAGTLPPPPAGKAIAANNALCKYPDSSASALPPDLVCASAVATAAAATAAANNNLVVYTVFCDTPASPHTQSNAADTSVRSPSTIPPPQSDQLDIEFFAEAQHSLGHLSVLFWSSCSLPTGVELDYELEDDVTLRVSANPSVKICVAVCESEVSSSSSSSGGERKHDVSHVRLRLPAEVVMGQKGRVRLESGSVCRLKLILTDEERERGKEESRAEGMVEFPLSVRELSQGGDGRFRCAVCVSKKVGMGKRGFIELRGGVRWRALPSEGWEELVDAWMCHGDQELNRSLTETAVRFSSRVHAEEEPRMGGEEEHEETVWVGDTYLLVPRRLFQEKSVVFDDAPDAKGQVAMRCSTCHSILGEISSLTSPAQAGTVVKLSKYTIATPSASNMWAGTLLATLQYSAASHGSRRFLIQSSASSTKIETWLFSRALFTTSLARHWSAVGGRGREEVWKGHRMFFRSPSDGKNDGDTLETIDLPEAVFVWLEEALQQCHESLPQELGRVLPEWKAAYLAKVVDAK